MVQQTVNATIDEQYTSRISSLLKERRDFFCSLNRVRWDKYRDEEAIFGFKYGDEYPSSNWNIPHGDQFNILTENATHAWGDALWNAILNGDFLGFHGAEQISSFNPSYDTPTFTHEFIHLNPRDYTLHTDTRTLVASRNDGSTLFEATIAHDENDPLEEIQPDTDQLRVEYGDLPNTTIYYEYGDPEQTQEPIKSSIQNLNATTDTEKQAAIAIAVAAGAYKVAQIEAPQESAEFEEMFEELNLIYEPINTPGGKSIYLVTNRESGEDLISAYLDASSHSLNDYLTLLGYPQEVSYFATDNAHRYTDEYDRYPSEEFVAYLVEDGQIPASDAQYYALCPYRAPPTKKQARYAIQLGKHVESTITDYCRNHNKLSASSVIQHLHTTTTPPTKPLFTSTNWPLTPQTDEQLQDETQQ